jgi:hypothetical protein
MNLCDIGLFSEAFGVNLPFLSVTALSLLQGLAFEREFEHQL